MFIGGSFAYSGLIVRTFICFCLAAIGAGAQSVSSSAPAPEPKKIDSLHELSATLEALSQHVSGSVVQIFSSGYALGGEGESGTNAAVITRQRASGSGVILSADGYIVTNRHVVANARKVTVRVPDQAMGQASLQPGGKLLAARIVGEDRDTDLAVLKIDRKGLSHLSLGDSDTLRQGQLVMAFGNPMGLQNSVSMGVVSSTARQLKPDDPMIYIQTDAPINPGNSGGPLVDADARVMGINTFILSQSGGSEGLGFAVPSNIIRNVYTQLRDSGHVHRSEIGVSAQTITPTLAAGLHLGQDWGVLLADVTPDGPAEKVGMQVGDIVVSLNGKPMQNARQMEINLYRYAVGEKVNVQVLREGDKHSYTVAVVERRDDPQRFADLVDPEKNTVRRLGILGIDIDQTVAAMLPGLRKQYGIVVAARAGDSPYAGDTLQPGDVIHAVNNIVVASVAVLRQALDRIKDTEPLVLQVERDGRLLYVTLEME
jgi:serine protease Do